MGTSAFYGTTDADESIPTIHWAIELGVTFFDTAELYGPPRQRGAARPRARRPARRAVIATKFGVRPNADGPAGRRLDGTPATVRASIEGASAPTT